MAEKQSLPGKRETQQPHIPVLKQAGQEQEPPFPVPPHLARADLPTLQHMERTLGQQTVQRYLLRRQQYDAVQHEQEVLLLLRRR